MIENEKPRTEVIQSWIDARLEKDDFIPCLFSILILNEEKRTEVEELLHRAEGHYTSYVDTIPGSWNLNDSWYEIPHVDCIVEYCGVYPIHWDINDVVLLENLYYNRDIYINVAWEEKQEDGTIKYVSNH